ncbi:PREDICTED: lactadherin-like isoform X2 [Acropora digitifera]|uniref:lactadherin-like isoform X2 n=1 Tax=Acropora digitifera TaxID=70779 RepID=UPI00077A3817|nr:PREDICTED: lactadherin-like isoform X2 [Acropora digitifera]
MWTSPKMMLKVLYLLPILVAMPQYSSAECDFVLGMESGLISDLQISASSRWDSNHAPSQARLNYQETTSKSGAWAAAHNNDKQWLQVFLGKTKITRVATQGRNYNPSWPYGSHSQWVTKYKLQYSNDGVTFLYYKEQGVVKEFTGNSDRDTVVENVLNPPIEAKFIRFQPTAWHGHISMRVELYGCPQSCLYAFDSQLTASSQWDGNHAPSQGKLNYQESRIKSGAWAAALNNGHQWLQVDLGSQKTVRTLATQGRNYDPHWPHGSHAQWVTKYKLQYSNDGLHFQYYKEQGAVKEFAGNTNRDTEVYHDLNPPVSARYFRFQPTSWHGHISMRVGLFGCPDR